MEGRLRGCEEQIRVLSGVNIKQERILIEVNQYFHHYIRSRKNYASTKELARASLGDLIKNQYKTLNNGQLLNQAFDFYSCGIRLQAHERKKLFRDHMLMAME